MNKVTKAAVLIAGLAFGAHAAGPLAGIGYDANVGAGHLGQVTARLGLGMNAVDVGVGLNVDPSKDSSYEQFQMTASAFFLGHLHDWGPVDTYFTAGGIFDKLPQKDDNIQISAVVGFQPEVTLLDHIVLSTRLGLEVPLMPDFMLHTAGSGISIVDGLNFKILF